MFDHKQYGPSKISVDSRVTGHEHRAPTDDSVRLLQEMQKKIRNEVVKAVPLEPNLLKALMWTEQGTLWPEVVVIYELNGVKYEAHTRITPDIEHDDESIRRAVVKTVAEGFAVAMLSGMNHAR